MRLGNYEIRFRLLPFFPKTIKKIMAKMNQKPLIFDVYGKPISVCSEPTLHLFRGSVCVWCHKTKEQVFEGVQDQEKKNYEIPPVSHKEASLDLNSPTSMTVNPPKREKSKEENIDHKESFKPASMDLNEVRAYCVKCRMRVPVQNPQYSQEESRRGIRRYLKGSCSICKTHVCAIVKKE